jgi:DNA-binding NtrC family response regulator
MSLTMVLADDHTVVRDGLRPWLETQTDLLVVGEATERREAVRQVAGSHPRVSILDIGIPALHGIEADPGSGMRGPGSQTLLSPKSKMLPAIVEIFLPHGQEFLTDRRVFPLN